jgi:hypothetical protein
VDNFVSNRFKTIEALDLIAFFFAARKRGDVAVVDIYGFLKSASDLIMMRAGLQCFLFGSTRCPILTTIHGHVRYKYFLRFLS